MKLAAPLNVETPLISKSLKVENPIVLIPAITPLEFTVTIPADTAVTFKFAPKSIVPAVPTLDPLSLTIIPVPEAITPDNSDPSP